MHVATVYVIVLGKFLFAVVNSSLHVFSINNIFL